MSSVRSFVLCMERLDVPRALLVAAAGISPDRLEDPDALAPCETLGAIVAAAQRLRPRRDLALALARVTPIGAYPLVDYLVVSSADVGEGLRRLARYYRLVGAPATLELCEEDDPVRVRFPAAVDPFAAEFSVALTLLHLRRESGGRVRALTVSFTHRPEAARELEEELECRIEAGASWCGFTLAPADLDIPMRRGDAALVGLLEPQAEAATAARRADDPLAVRVRQAIASRLADAEPEIATVARDLALAPRTLQRRLADEGTSFQRVLDDVRRESAERHLRDSVLSIAEIAFLLGFSEPAAFHRAFRRWNGVTPQSFRARSLGKIP